MFYLYWWDWFYRRLSACSSEPLSLIPLGDGPWFCVKGRVATPVGRLPLMQVLDWLGDQSVERRSKEIGTLALFFGELEANISYSNE